MPPIAPVGPTAMPIIFHAVIDFNNLLTQNLAQSIQKQLLLVLEAEEVGVSLYWCKSWFFQSAVESLHETFYLQEIDLSNWGNLTAATPQMAVNLKSLYSWRGNVADIVLKMATVLNAYHEADLSRSVNSGNSHFKPEPRSHPWGYKLWWGGLKSKYNSQGEYTYFELARKAPMILEWWVLNRRMEKVRNMVYLLLRLLELWETQRSMQWVDTTTKSWKDHQPVWYQALNTAAYTILTYKNPRFFLMSSLTRGLTWLFELQYPSCIIISRWFIYLLWYSIWYICMITIYILHILWLHIIYILHIILCILCTYNMHTMYVHIICIISIEWIVLFILSILCIVIYYLWFII